MFVKLFNLVPFFMASLTVASALADSEFVLIGYFGEFNGKDKSNG
jgi:hypothetical protein